MKKALSSFLGSASLLLFPSVVFAAETSVNPCPGGGFGPLCNFTTSNFSGIIGSVITLLFVIAVLIALGFLIYGGIKWIISGGDKTAVEAARNHIVSAIIGLIIVFLAFFILNVVIGFFLPGFSLTNLTLPSIQVRQ